MQVQDWVEFVEGNQQRHLVAGSTDSVARWREKGLRHLVHALAPSGQFAFKRDLDGARALYLVLVAFEHEGDAEALAHVVGANPVADYSGFASLRAFTIEAKKVRAALKRLRFGGRLLPH